MLGRPYLQHFLVVHQLGFDLDRGLDRQLAFHVELEFTVHLKHDFDLALVAVGERWRQIDSSVRHLPP